MGALFRVLLMTGLVVRLWWIAVTLGCGLFAAHRSPGSASVGGRNVLAHLRED
jgi:hypothetical protein